jgi:epoxyqueuosine reductase QueG
LRRKVQHDAETESNPGFHGDPLERKETMQNALREALKKLVKEHTQDDSIRTAWGEPLLGFADAGDPLFQRLKEVVRPSHALPPDLLPNARTVVAYFIPFHKDIPKSNRKDRYASKAWAIAYIETNQLIREVNRHLATLLAGEGFRSADLPPTHNFDTDQLMSDWSHKHVGYIAGIGTFGMHHLLITEKGCCGRLGSLVTAAEIPPTERPRYEYCLFKYNGSCRVCAPRCPVEAFHDDSFARHKCYDLLLKNAAIYQDEGLADVCGKCSTIVPCSFLNPVKKLKKGERKAAP